MPSPCAGLVQMLETAKETSCTIMDLIDLFEGLDWVQVQVHVMG